MVRPAQVGPGLTRRLVSPRPVRWAERSRPGCVAACQTGQDGGPETEDGKKTRAVKPPEDGLPKTARRLRDRIDYVV